MNRGNRTSGRRRLAVLVAILAALLATSGVFATAMVVTANSDAGGSAAVPECQPINSALQVHSDDPVFDAGTGSYMVPGVTVDNINAACRDAGLGLYLTAFGPAGASLRSVGPLLIDAGSVHFDFPSASVPMGELQGWAVAIHGITTDPPTGLHASVASATSASLSWTAPTTPLGYPVTDYVVEYSANSGTSWTTFNDGVSAAASTTVTGLSVDNTYLFRVHAVSAFGAGPAATYSFVRTSLPGVPVGLAVTAGPAPHLTWSAPTPVTGAPVTDYSIAYSSDGGSSWTTFEDGIGTTTEASVPGLQANLPYLFQVRAVNAVGAGLPATTTNPVTLDATAPAAVASLSATPGVTSVSLAWDAPTRTGTQAAVTGYVVQHSTDHQTWSTLQTTGSGTLEYHDVDLVPGTTYYYRVYATSSAGNGAIASYVSGVPIEPAPIPVPGGVTITTDHAVTATITWTGANDMDIEVVDPNNESTDWYYDDNRDSYGVGGYLEYDVIPTNSRYEPTPESAAESYVENLYYDAPAVPGQYKFYLNFYSHPHHAGYFHPGYWTYTIRVNGVIAWQSSGSLGTYWYSGTELQDDVRKLIKSCTPNFTSNTCN